MPQFEVPLQGGGTITVNASDAGAALENAQQQSGTPPSGSGIHQVQGDQPSLDSQFDYTAGSADQNAYNGVTAQNTGNTQNDAAMQQYAAAWEKIQNAIAARDEKAFQEGVREFDLYWGLDQNKFAEDIRQFNQNFGLLQGGLTGTYQGQPTLAAQKQASDLALAAAGLTGTYQGQQTLQAQQQGFTQGLQGVTLAAGLQANPFRQQQVLGQLGPLLTGQGMAQFQAPNTVAGVGTAGGNTQGGLGYLQQMIDDIRNPTANTANVNQVLDAIPTPNKLNSVDFLRASPSTQQMILQGMTEKYGVDPNDAMAQIKATLPQFQAPTTVGTIRR